MKPNATNGIMFTANTLRRSAVDGRFGAAAKAAADEAVREPAAAAKARAEGNAAAATRARRPISMIDPPRRSLEMPPPPRARTLARC